MLRPYGNKESQQLDYAEILLKGFYLLCHLPKRIQFLFLTIVTFNLIHIKAEEGVDDNYFTDVHKINSYDFQIANDGHGNYKGLFNIALIKCNGFGLNLSSNSNFTVISDQYFNLLGINRGYTGVRLLRMIGNDPIPYFEECVKDIINEYFENKSHLLLYLGGGVVGGIILCGIILGAMHLYGKHSNNSISYQSLNSAPIDAVPFNSRLTHTFSGNRQLLSWLRPSSVNSSALVVELDSSADRLERRTL